MKTLKGYLFAILSAVIYGLMPLMASHIYADGVNAMTLVLLRNLLALPVLAVLAFCQQKTLKVPAKALGGMAFLAAFGCCITPVLLFSSYHYIPSGTATTIHFVYPAIVVLIGILFLKKKAQLGTVLSLVLCVGGICLFYKPGADFHWGGAGLALLSGVTFAIYVAMLPVLRQEQVKGFLFTFYIALCSTMMMAIACVATDNLVLPQSLTGWAWCLLFALGVTAGAVVLFQQGTFLIGPERASILSTFEPITSVVVGVVFMEEVIGLRDYVGIALVLAASVLIALFDMKKKTA
ncbi:MAG: EamA family transporter [Oscillospiraceae bacterium]|nr:EamA family transporter [Oscillospiraceae bacterium]